MKKRFLALLLTLAICVTFMPTLAFMTAPEVDAEPIIASLQMNVTYDSNGHGVFKETTAFDKWPNTQSISHGNLEKTVTYTLRDYLERDTDEDWNSATASVYSPNIGLEYVKDESYAQNITTKIVPDKGYQFIGWFSEAQGGIQVDFDGEVSPDITDNTYDGWYIEQIGAGEKYKSGNITFYAHWKKISDDAHTWEYQGLSGMDLSTSPDPDADFEEVITTILRRVFDFLGLVPFEEHEALTYDAFKSAGTWMNKLFKKVIAKCQDEGCNVDEQSIKINTTNTTYTGQKYNGMTISDENWKARGLSDYDVYYVSLGTPQEIKKEQQREYVSGARHPFEGIITVSEEAPTNAGLYIALLVPEDAKYYESAGSYITAEDAFEELVWNILPEFMYSTDPEETDWEDTWHDCMGILECMSLMGGSIFCIEPATLKYKTAPVGKKLSYTGKEQDLVTAGVPDGISEFEYRLVGEEDCAYKGRDYVPAEDEDYNVDESEWSTTVPQAQKPGEYTVEYRVVPNSTAVDKDAFYTKNYKEVYGSLTATIGSADSQHDWHFTQNGNVIKAYCSDDCDVSNATLTLDAKTVDYDGGLYNQATVKFNDDWMDERSGLGSRLNANNVTIDYYQYIDTEKKAMKKLNYTPKDAGDYAAVVAVYTEADPLETGYRANIDINKGDIEVVYAIKDFKINAVEFDGYEVPVGNELTYNGKAQTLIKAGKVTEGNGEMQYSLDGTTWVTDVTKITGKDAKSYEVKWQIVTKDHLDQSGTVTAVINPFAVGVKWGSTSLVYNGTSQAPKATAQNLFGNDTCKLTVSGGQVAVTPNGEVYLAKVVGTDNPNYAVPNNAEIEYIIVAEKEPILLAKAVASAKAPKQVKVSWQKVDGAAYYIVKGAQCGKKMRVLKKNVVKASFVNKNLKKNTYYKYVVTAHDAEGKVIATSNTLHVVTGQTNGNYANVTAIKATPSSYKDVEVGDKFKVKATYRVYKNKKLTKKWHADKFRYLSDDTTVATVNGNGVVKVKRSGTVNIYIQAPNGLWKKVNVQVAR